MNKIHNTVTLKLEGKDVSLIFKDTAISEMKATSTDEGVMTFYTSVFGNVDSYGDIMQRGSFANAIAEWKADGKYPKVVWNHDWMQPLGKVIDMTEDEFGLKVTVAFNMDVQRTRELWSLYKQGALTDFSFGYSVTADDYDSEGHRLIKSVRLYEVSPVLIGANRLTHVVDMKADGEPVDPVPPAPVDEPATPAEVPAEVSPAPLSGSENAENGSGEGSEVPADGVGEGSADENETLEIPKSLVKDIMEQLEKSPNEATTAIKTALKALKRAVEVTPVQTGVKHEVDQHTSNELKLVLRNAQHAVKASTAVIVSLKRHLK